MVLVVYCVDELMQVRGVERNEVTEGQLVQANDRRAPNATHLFIAKSRATAENFTCCCNLMSH